MCLFVCCLSSVHDHVSHSSTVRKIQIDSSCFINVLNKKIMLGKSKNTIINNNNRNNDYTCHMKLIKSMVCHFVCPTMNPAKESTVYTHQCQIDGVDGWMVDDCSNLQ